MEKTTIYLILILFAALIFTSCNNKLNQNDLVGKSFNIDSYHMIRFTSLTSFEIAQYTNSGKSCLGTGTWSFSDDLVLLSNNDSQCESTRYISGQFHISGKWLEK